MGNDQLKAFHPVPRGLHRDRRFRPLGSLAKLLLLEAHMFADDTESDGVLSESDLVAVAGLAGVPVMGIGATVQELLDSTLLATQSGNSLYSLTDFRGLSAEAHERNREKGREKMRRRRGNG